ncbi:hypothetical protein B9Z19DRAFT_1125278 [Tuber borchii]|uniref:Uncharacterized protein n=1 Tax=Tuber borchii TaxID=42251 RepID=A0A2T6ZV59_TUBBO|nr:hypothetical protein B9Z19DRAFT_1125278 [Tuber borchii]
MALQSLIKGGSLCQAFLDVWKVLALNPDSGSVRHVITESFYNVVLRHPICPPPKGHLHMSILHSATESSEGGSLCRDFFVRGGSRALTLKTASEGVRHAIAKPC